MQVVIGIVGAAITLIIAALVAIRSKSPKDVPIAPAWIIVIGIFLSVIVARTTFWVPPAHVGTVYDPIHGGIQLSTIIPEGFNFVSPFYETATFSKQSQEYTMSATKDEGAVIGDDSIHCQTNEGMGAYLDLTVIWHEDPIRAPYLWANLGTDYQLAFIRPIVQEAIRMVVAKYGVMDVYSKYREQAQREIVALLQPIFSKYGLVLEDIKIRQIDPYKDNGDFKASIDRKQAAQQNVSTERQHLLQAKYERETKVNTAKGEYQTISQKAMAITQNPGIIDYEIAKKLAPKVTTVYMPSSDFISGGAK